MILSVFAAFCFFYAPVVYLFYPETANRTLEDMDQIFLHNPSWLVCGKDELTGRARPQVLIDAETDRLARGAATPPEASA